MAYMCASRNSDRSQTETTQLRRSTDEFGAADCLRKKNRKKAQDGRMDTANGMGVVSTSGACSPRRNRLNTAAKRRSFGDRFQQPGGRICEGGRGETERSSWGNY